MKSSRVGALPMLCASVLSLACAAGERITPLLAADATDASLVQLIANPAEYDGRIVRVIGFCRLEFEGNVLYLHREDFEWGISRNAVWLNVGWPPTASQRSMSDSYVVVEAVFDARNHGHMGLFSGALKDIRRIERWPSRREIGEPPKPPPKPSR